MTIAELENALAALGTTANEIAARLTAEGCTGFRGPYDCPVAEYLRRTFGQTLSVCFDETFSLSGNAITLMQTPAPIRRFIAAFDRGRYPQLRRCPKLHRPAEASAMM
jgi:hypothetical protein